MRTARPARACTPPRARPASCCSSPRCTSRARSPACSSPPSRTPSPIWIPAGRRRRAARAARPARLGRRPRSATCSPGSCTAASRSASLGAQGAANALAAAGAAWAIVRFAVAGGPAAPRCATCVLLAVVVAPGAAAFSATAGVLALVAGDGLPAAEAGDGVADVADERHHRRARARPRAARARHAAVAAARPPRRALEAAGMVARARRRVRARARARAADTSYLVFPVLVWAALRFRVPGAAAMSLLAAVVSVAMAARGHGPFGIADGLEALLHTQGFIAVSTLTALVLALAGDEREAALRRARAPRAARPAHRAAQPRPARRAARAGDAARRARRHGARRPADRPRRVQDRQRLASATTPATSCSARSPRGCGPRARPQDTVARFGGDEFVVLCEGLAGPWDALEAARRLAAAWAEPFRARRRRRLRVRLDRHRASRSAGAPSRARCCARPTPRCTAPRRAAAGRSSSTTRRCAPRAFERLRLEGDLRRALAEGGIERRVPADPRPAHRPAARRRGARPLGAPRARRGLARRCSSPSRRRAG